MPTPAVQALEREAFVRHGWEWLDYRRRGWELTREGERTRAVVEFQAPDGRTGRYEATLRVRRRVPVPKCGEPLAHAVEDQPEFAVEDLRTA